MKTKIYKKKSHQISIPLHAFATDKLWRQKKAETIEYEFKRDLPSVYAEQIQIAHAKFISNMHKKKKGQYFTPKIIADFMGNLAHPKYSKISILDPGCGTAILSCSLIENLINKNKIREINLTLFEDDPAVIIEAKKVIAYLKEWLLKRHIILNAKMHIKDFVLSNANAFFKNTLFENTVTEKYDYIISNPPYFKISKFDNRAQIAKELVFGQPNIYSIFMGLSAKLLNPDGELMFIVPRSFAAGNYFKSFRKSFLNDVSISDIHIFNSRKQMFKNDNVLQENVIIRATNKINANIKISVSESEKDLKEPRFSIFKTKELIDLSTRDKILFMPSNPKETETINIFKNWHNSLADYNIQVSTGPVVAFRCKKYLTSEKNNNMNVAPLFWLHNVKEMEFIFPLRKKGKTSYIIDSKESQKVLLENKNYILIRRFSSKDDKNRLVCSPYFASSMAFERIGVENHLNYIYRPNGELAEEEIWGVSALFSSSLFDTYFRTFNGNTQVGASELKQINIPPINQVILIGEKVKKMKQPQKKEIDDLINKILLRTINV